MLTVVIPSGKVLPEGGLALIVGLGSAISTAPTKVTTAPAALVASTVILPLTMLPPPTVGGVVSWTVTLKLVVLVLLASSLAVMVTVVKPSGKNEPVGLL